MTELTVCEHCFESSHDGDCDPKSLQSYRRYKAAAKLYPPENTSEVMEAVRHAELEAFDAGCEYEAKFSRIERSALKEALREVVRRADEQIMRGTARWIPISARYLLTDTPEPDLPEGARWYSDGTLVGDYDGEHTEVSVEDGELRICVDTHPPHPGTSGFALEAPVEWVLAVLKKAGLL